MIKRIIKHIRGETGSSDYISATVFILVAAVMIMLILDVFSIISAKQQIDTTADQLVRQIQLAGKVEKNDVESLIQNMSTVNKAETIQYNIETTYMTNGDGCRTAIQLGTPFSVTVKADVMLGGFWQITGQTISLSSTSSGVSERYWK